MLIIAKTPLLADYGVLIGLLVPGAINALKNIE